MTDAKTFDVDRNPVQYRVEYRENWGDPWLYDEHLFPNEVLFSMAPKISTATLGRHYGRIHTNGSGFSDVEALDLSGKFVRVTLTKGDNSDVWHGYCPAPSDRIDGTLKLIDAEVPRGMTTYSCYGLEWLLQDTAIAQTTKVDNITINRVLPYNRIDSQRMDSVAGNRSDNIGSGSVYHFSEVDESEWSGLDVVEHLLHNWSLQTDGVLSFDVVTGGGNAYVDLDNIKGAWMFDGMNYYEAINSIVSPGNGFAYYVRVSGNQPEIVVFPAVDVDIKDDGATIITKNDLSLVLDLDYNPDVRQATVAHIDNAHYDEIEVRGGRLRTCFTISTSSEFNTDSILEKGWTPAAEIGYESVDDEYRALEESEATYTRFTMPATWNGNAGAERCFPKVDESTGKPTPVSDPQNVFLRNRVFDRSLPWAEIDNETQPRRPFAIYADDGGKWHRTERPGIDGATPVGLKILDNQMGIQLTTGNKLNHIVAKDTFAGTSDTAAEWDFNKVLATVSMISDEHARVVVIAEDPEPGQIRRRKIINRPDLQVWYVVPGTVKSFLPDESGVDALVTAGVDGEFPRDDSEKIKRIANLAKSFFGKRRQRLSVDYGSFDLAFGSAGFLGFFVSEASAGQASQNIDTMVTELRYTLSKNYQQQSIVTDFFSLDFGRIGRISGDAGLFGADRDELANIPVRHAGGSGGGGSYSGQHAVSINSGSESVSIAPGVFSGGEWKIDTDGAESVSISSAETQYVVLRVFSVDGQSYSHEYKIETAWPNIDNEIIGGNDVYVFPLVLATVITSQGKRSITQEWTGTGHTWGCLS